MRKRILLLSAATLALSAVSSVSSAALTAKQKFAAARQINSYLESHNKGDRISVRWVNMNPSAAEAAFEHDDWRQVDAAFGITPPAATGARAAMLTAIRAHTTPAAAPAPTPAVAAIPPVATLPSTTPDMVRTTSSASGSTHDGSGSVDGSVAGSTAGSTHDGSGSVDGSGVDVTEGHTTLPAAAAPVRATPPAAATTTPASPRSSASPHSTTSSATSASPNRRRTVSPVVAERSVQDLVSALSSFDPGSTTDGTSSGAAFLRELVALKTQLDEDAEAKARLVDATREHGPIRGAVHTLTDKIPALVSHSYSNATDSAQRDGASSIRLVSEALVAGAGS